MAEWKKRSEMRVLGKSRPRLDGPAKVTGAAKYAYDVNPTGLLQARIIRCPHAHATVESVDPSSIERMPGVKAVIITAKTGDRLVFAGQEIGAVAATTIEQAEDAARALNVKYKVLPHVVHEDKAMSTDAPRVRENQPNVLEKPNVRAAGDIEAGFRECAAVSTGKYSVAVREHLSLETHGVTCRWDDDTHLTCWASTQGIFSVRDELAPALGLKPEDVTVITEYMGGGFGSKFGMGYEGINCARLAKKAGAPVKLMLTREEEQLAVGNAPSSTAAIKIGANKEGKILAFEAKAHACGGIAGAGVSLPYIYDQIPNIKVEQTPVFTHTGPQRAWRAPGHPQASFLMESAIDDLAYKLGMDPLEVRIKNDTSQQHSAAMRQKQWVEGARLIDWNRRNKKPGIGALAGVGRYKRGLGCGAARWGGGGGGGNEARVTIHRDGRVLVEHGVQDIGTGTRTYVGMIVAEELGIPPSRVSVEVGSSKQPRGPASGGSVTTGSTAPPVKKAAEAAKQALFEAAAPRMNVKAEDLEAEDGKVFVRSDPAKSVPFEQACSALGPAGVTGNGKWDASLRQDGVAGAQFVEVEVDTETGHVQVVKVVALQDGGIILNPLTYTSQINGGVIQGIGMALQEDRRMCQLTGRMVNPNMEWYKVPGTMDMPEFVSVPFENPDAKGVSGIGEPPVIPTAGAIRNAILNATGAYLYHAPMTPGDVLEALAAARRRA